MRKNIIITGASSGLGKALALRYASSKTRLFLFGRNAQNLEEVAKGCRAKNADVHIIINDVKNQELMSQALYLICQNYMIDTVIACAGVSAGTLGGPESTSQVNQIFSTNLNGVLNTILPIIPHMINHKQGSIVIIGSMAGLLPLSSAPSYSASKAAVMSFANCLRPYLKAYGIKVSIVVPGYVDTPMTKVNKFPMPFKISADRASDIIYNKVQQGRGIIYFPILMYIITKILDLLPYQLMDYINSKLPGKASLDRDDIKKIE